MQPRKAEANAVVERHLPVIEEVIRSVSRSRRLGREEKEELRSDVMLKLLDRDGRVFRRFQGRSCVKTYLTAVVGRVLLDRRTRDWGRWRSSAAARRLGWVGIKLEELLVRDRYRLEEAIEILRTNYGVASTREELKELAASLPVRMPRRLESPKALESLPGPSRADRAVEARECLARARRTEALLEAAVNSLSDADQRLLRLRFQEGRTVADIARRSGARQRKLYARLGKVLKSLRRRMEADGVTRRDVLELCGWSGLAPGRATSRRS